MGTCTLRETASKDFPKGFTWSDWLIATSIAVLPRLIMIWLGGIHAGGDSKVYLIVAENIHSNGCVSMSTPSTGECLPHWGGNQLPGYPAFIAAAWTLMGHSLTSVVVAQSLVTAIAIAFVGDAVRRTSAPTWVSWPVVITLGVSPSLVGWSRSILTESLSIALALTLLALLIRSFAVRRLKTLPIAIALAAGIFVRYDFVSAAVPIAISGLLLHRALDAVWRGVLILILVAIPFGSWTARCIAAGLPPSPPFGLTPQGEPLPTGMLSWTRTWIDDQYDLRASIWALVTFDYESFRPPKKAYANDDEANEVEKTLQLLRSRYQGAAPPEEYDKLFGHIADRKARQNPFKTYVALPFTRMIRMWTSPYPSMGWPAEVSDTDRESLRKAWDRSLADFVEISTTETPAVFMKVTVSGHRYVLIIVAVGLALMSFWLPVPGMYILWLSLAYAVSRTVALAQMALLETRYLTPSLAWLEVSAAVVVSLMLAQHHRPRDLPKRVC
jgi:hypothetical protein